MTLPLVRGKYKLNYNLAHLTWFKVGGAADILFKPKDAEDLASFLQQNANTLPVTVLGAGSNMIIRDKGIEGVVVKLGQGFTAMEILPDGKLSVGAGCLNFNLAKFAQGHCLKGFEFLVGIPGTIGGGVAMNAGAYGNEFKDIVSSVWTLDKNGKSQQIYSEDIGFSYRKNALSEELIFTKVLFKTKLGDADRIQARMDEIGRSRASTQPITEKTGGSTFANPPGRKAWELIDAAGLRDKRLGDASMSSKHCNFMINNGKATASDMEELGELVRKEVKEQSGVELKWEIKRIGRDGRV